MRQNRYNAKKDIPLLCKNTAYHQWQHAFKASTIDYFYAISNTAKHIDFTGLCEQSTAMIDGQKRLLANNQIIVAKHQETNGLQSQKINLL